MDFKTHKIFLFLFFIPVAFGSYLFHEFGHWLVGEILGNDMVFSLNLAYAKSGYYVNESHNLPISIGGPAFTMLLGFIFLLVIEKSKIIYFYPIVFFQFFIRFFSIIFGGFANQDEARIAEILGIWNYTVAIIVLLILFLFVVRASKRLKISLQDNGYYFAMSTVSILLVITIEKLL